MVAISEIHSFYSEPVWGMSVADKSLMLDLTVYAKYVFPD